MKVYIAYDCYYNYCDEFCIVTHVFDCEFKALLWKDEIDSTETEYRTYEEKEVE